MPGPFDRGVEFYRQALGWQIQKWEGPVEYWLVKMGVEGQPGIDGAIMRREGQGTTFNTVDMPAVDEYIQRVVAAGGKAISPKSAVPGVGWFAYVADTEGNVFGLMQSDPNAG